MAERIETIQCRTRQRKGKLQHLPSRPLHLRTGDWAERVTESNGRTSIVVHRAGFWKRTWLAIRGGE